MGKNADFSDWGVIFLVVIGWLRLKIKVGAYGERVCLKGNLEREFSDNLELSENEEECSALK